MTIDAAIESLLTRPFKARILRHARACAVHCRIEPA